MAIRSVRAGTPRKHLRRVPAFLFWDFLICYAGTLLTLSLSDANYFDIKIP